MFYFLWLFTFKVCHWLFGSCGCMISGTTVVHQSPVYARECCACWPSTQKTKCLNYYLCVTVWVTKMLSLPINMEICWQPTTKKGGEKKGMFLFALFLSQWSLCVFIHQQSGSWKWLSEKATDALSQNVYSGWRNTLVYSWQRGHSAFFSLVKCIIRINGELSCWHLGSCFIPVLSLFVFCLSFRRRIFQS